MKTENTYELKLEEKLCDKKFQGVLDLLQDPINSTYIKSNTWHLISTVCLTLKTKDDLLENESDLEICKKILFYLADTGNPKEVVVALMEEADSFKAHSYFCLLLDPLKYTLIKVPGKRGKSLEWVLSSLNAHILTLPLPEDLDLQAEEKLLLDVDAAVIDTNYILSNYLPFLQAFVDEVSFANVKNRNNCFSERIIHQREILQRYILMLFDHPLVYHDLHVPPDKLKPKSTIRSHCESCMASLAKITPNVFNLFKYNIDLKATDGEEDKVPLLALSNLAYLIFVENLALNFQPIVLSHKYLFIKNLKYIVQLLSRVENLVLFKGLHLAQVLLDGLSEFEISYDLLEIDAFVTFPKGLLTIAVFSKIEVHRKMSVKIFLSYVSKCDWKARYHLILHVLSTANHSGPEGLVINLFKDYLHEHLSGKVTDTYILGKNLISFLKKVFYLKDGVETDLLENSDRILSALNLLRYLLLRDKKEENVTGIWDLSDFVTVNFIEPLSKGLDLSKAHYQQMLKDTETNTKYVKKGIDPIVSVNNKPMPQMPLHLQKDVLQKALLAFDLINSILSRVREFV